MLLWNISCYFFFSLEHICVCMNCSDISSSRYISLWKRPRLLCCLYCFFMNAPIVRDDCKELKDHSLFISFLVMSWRVDCSQPSTTLCPFPISRRHSHICESQQFQDRCKKIVTTTRVGNKFQFLDEMKKRSKISLRKSCQAPTFDLSGESLFFLLGPIKIKHKKMWNWLCKKRQTIKLKQVRCVWNERKKKKVK